MSLLTALKISTTPGFYKDVAPLALGKYPEGFPNQPRVLATKDRLRWVVNHELKSTVKELRQIWRK